MQTADPLIYPSQVSAMLSEIRAAEARRAQQVNRRKPENAHLRELWDAKHRAAEAGDWEAYDNIEATIKLYKAQPETAAKQSLTPSEVTSISSREPSVKAISGGVIHQFRQNAIDKETQRQTLAAAVHA